MSALFEHIVNGQSIITSIEFKGNKHIFHFPELFKNDKLDRTSMWRIYVIKDQYYRESNIKGGKIKTYAPVVCTPKNIGKANETTSEMQALFEAFSEWKHKKDQLYTEKQDDITKCNVRPMLAEKWTERSKYAQFPGAVSEKLDGVRVMCHQDEKGIHLISRQGKVYMHMNGIREECRQIFSKYPNIVLDGEIYSHDIPFNAISGAVRSQTKPSKFDDLIGTVGKIGQQEKANRDLETKIDQEKSRISSNNVDRIKQDLEAIAKENAQLVAQIKAASAKAK